MSQSGTSSIGAIAIIGMNGRFPGAKNIEEFWQNLRDGVESITFFKDEELLSAGIQPEVLKDPDYVKAGAPLEDIELFDASFFGYNPKEAAIIDPQHRIFLECAWEALESAGYNSENYPGRIGIIAGSGLESYLLFNLASNGGFQKSMAIYQTLIGNEKDFLTTRVSYHLNLKGPSLDVQTACSTSLVAISLACQSLLNYQCDMALAGGITISVPQKSGYFYQEEGVLSPDGHCRAFDAKARGTIIGDGVGIVVLKRLEDAIADGDNIRAVIRGFAINNDGSLKVGYTAPSVEGQAEAIAEAIALAGIDAETITYVEAHGTGTAMGDPIEIAALTRAFRANTEKNNFCAIGSVKTNVGHLDAASGVASLIKTVLAIEHQLIPPNLHFEAPNPQIDFANSPFYVNAKLSEWQRNGNPRRAGVSSFGLGGSNAHVIVEEAPVIEASTPARPWQLLLLSAKTNSALEKSSENLANYLQQHPDINLADVAYTLQIGRRTFERRRAIVCRDVKDAVVALKDPKRILTSDRETIARPVAFIFPGLGTQYVNMGWELYQLEPTFREEVDRCCELLKPLLDVDLREIIYPRQSPNNETAQSSFDLRKMLGRGEQKFDETTEKLNRTIFSQPAIFVIEYALAKLWMSWGIHPTAAIGYSIGEYVAACIAGVLSLREALTLVAKRAQMIEELPSGAMLAIPLSEEEVQPFLSEKLSLSAINGLSLCVVAGEIDAVVELQRNLTEKGLAVRRLATSHAFHSQMMEAIASPFTELVKSFNLQPPEIPFISNVTGTWITDVQATDPNYWTKHLCLPVRFAQGVRELWKEDNPILLEVGPGQTLSSLAMQCLERDRFANLTPQPPSLVGKGEKKNLTPQPPSLVGKGEKKNLTPQPPSLVGKGENFSPLPASGRGVGGERSAIALPTLRADYDSQSDIAFSLNTLGRLWLAGTVVNWSEFYDNERRHRLPLPTYPFERQRYWIEAEKISHSISQERTALAEKLDVTNWFYIPSWKRSILVETEPLISQKHCWLVFVDEGGVAAQIVARLKRRDRSVIAVKIGKQFGRIGEDEYTVNPQKSEDYSDLLKAIRALGKIPKMIAHFWNVTANDKERSPLENLEHSVDIGFWSLIYLAQAIGDQMMTESLQICAVTNNLQQVLDEAELHPEKALILGPCRVISQEYPHINCRSIDITLPLLSIDRLMVELSSESTDAIVAYRGDRRWVQYFEPFPIEAQIASPSRLRQGGVYLVTGGLGELGLVFAEYLAKTVQAKLVLIGRSHVSEKLEKVRALEELGAEVLVLQADVSDLEQMKAAIAAVRERFGTLHGVIHAAGVAGVGLVQLKTPEITQSVFNPKVKGTLVLEEVLQDVALDFLVLFSSNTAITGGVGQVDYCAANAFLDAIAHYHTSQGKMPVVSINWDWWQGNNWADSLMAVVPEIQAQFKQMREKYGIEFAEGVDAFDRILSAKLPQAIVSTQNLQTAIAQMENFAAPSTSEKSEPSSAFKHPRPILGVAYAPPSNEVEQKIAALWSNFLGIEEVGIYDNFFDLGGHSLIATQLVSQLRKDFQVEISLRHIFEAPSVAQLALIIEEEILGELEELTEEEAKQLASVVSTQERTQTNSQRRYKLPNNLEIAHQSKAETDYFYEDIFKNQVYVKHGIKLPDRACIFDVGANIGMFTLFAHHHCKNATIYAFEPAPPLFEILRLNATLHEVNAKLFNCGVSKEKKTATFTFYPHSSGMSSFYADLEEEKDVLKAIVQNQLQEGRVDMTQVMEYSDELLSERFKSQTFTCQLIALSDAIAETAVDRIDLLKIDVQKSELDVLEGILEKDWQKIEQIVIEVHDIDGRLQRIANRLEKQGYKVAAEQENLYEGSNIYNVYAIR